MDTEIMLECARKAYPGDSWRENGYGQIVNALGQFFNIKDEMWGHAMALQIALEKEGWIFKFGFFEEFEAERGHGPRIVAKTKPDLLIAIVRAGCAK